MRTIAALFNLHRCPAQKCALKHVFSTVNSIHDDAPGGAGSADATAAAVGLSFDVGTSGVAGEMMGSIYRSLKALQNKVSSATFMDGMGWNLRAP
jgi:hypothetical protein